MQRTSQINEINNPIENGSKNMNRNGQRVHIKGTTHGSYHKKRCSISVTIR